MTASIFGAFTSHLFRVTKIFSGFPVFLEKLVYNTLMPRYCGIRENPAVPVFGNKMAKKQFFAIVDTETTMADTVADFGILICDREGTIYNQCAVLVHGHYGVHELFHDKAANDIWGYGGLEKRKAAYTAMLNSGVRMVAGVSAINRWIDQAIGKYNPELTAYNLAFDTAKCANTGIQLEGFKSKFCLWQAAVGNICQTKQYKQFVLENHGFNAPTAQRNMTMQTNAEMVCGFIQGEFKIEPHTAIEDARDFELPILREILKKKKWKEKITPYNWREFQVKNHFTAK